MGQTPLTAYEMQQIAQIAAWKARRTGFLRRTLETVKWPIDQLFERLIPSRQARAMLAKAHRATDWERSRHLIAKVQVADRLDFGFDLADVYLHVR